MLISVCVWTNEKNTNQTCYAQTSRLWHDGLTRLAACKLVYHGEMTPMLLMGNTPGLKEHTLDTWIRGFQQTDKNAGFEVTSMDLKKGEWMNCDKTLACKYEPSINTHDLVRPYSEDDNAVLLTKKKTYEVLRIRLFSALDLTNHLNAYFSRPCLSLCRHQ